MHPKSRKLLEDMRDAASQVAALTAGKVLNDYLASQQFRWAVERGFEIVGEALAQVNKIDPPTACRITEYRKIISFRNVLIHGYGAVDHKTTWDIIQQDLPVLRQELDTLLR